MARKNNNTRNRKHDTRMTFRALCRAIGVTPRQRIQIYRYMRNKRKAVDIKS